MTGTLPLKLLAGSCRSGTTWLLDVLCQANNLHPVFEPLHPAVWKQAAPLARRYADAEQAWPELEQLWQKILRRKYVSTWSDYRVRPDRLRPNVTAFSSIKNLKLWLSHYRALWRNRARFQYSNKKDGLLVKTIRANLMTGFLQNNFSAEVALVIRNPAAVVESQLRTGFDWNAERIAAYYANDPLLGARLSKPWSKWASQMRNDAEMFTLIWGVENLLPIVDLRNTGAPIVFYEHLASGSDVAWAELMRGLNLANRPDQSMVERPSQQASKLHDGAITADSLQRPLQRMSTEHRDSVQRVLDMMNVEFYATESIFPTQQDGVSELADKQSLVISRSH